MALGDDRLDPVAVAVDVAHRLEALGVPYVVGGSLASSRHGEPRATLDVDLIARLTPQTARRLARMMQADYYVDEDAASEAAAIASSFNAVHLASAIKVDVFVVGDEAFEAERLRCRERVQLGAETNDALWMDTAEHTVLRKLEWYRRGGEVSERQWRDVLGIIRIQGERLDRARLTEWAEHLGVSDLLERALSG
ncbi:MAG: hypothetical protein ACRENU_04445 [Gemmatimonadaceae bacterium]